VSTETAKIINQTELALVVDCPSVTRCKYQSKIRAAVDYVGVTRWRFVSQFLSHMMNGLETEASSSELYSFVKISTTRNERQERTEPMRDERARRGVGRGVDGKG
jgi:hypothetical protein